MKRVIWFLDDLTDTILALVFTVLLVLGIWAAYDIVYVYYNTAVQRDSEIFPDGCVSWLSVEDTSIDYPVMQAEDNQKYLNTDPNGNYSLSGSIFLDYRNSSDFSDSYSLLYGHHMAGGYMFGALDSYQNEAYFESHRVGTLKTKENNYRLEAFSVLLTDASEKTLFKPGDGEAVIRFASENALLFHEPETMSNVLALSTCTGSDTSRMVVLFSILEDEE